MTVVTRRTLFSVGLVAGTGWAVTACSSQSPQSESSSSSGNDGGTAITHVHAITRDTATGVILLATHQGLFLLENKELTQVGPTVDLMGFTSTGGGRYLASGHPGPGVELPEPLGLVESTNGGQTWSVLSRAGESDFHALTAGPDRILAFDGQLRTSTDGRTWETVAIPSAPMALAIAPGGGATLVGGGLAWTLLDVHRPSAVLIGSTEGAQ